MDLGRAWQIGLFAGLLIWLTLVLRATLPAFKNPGEQRHLLALFLVSSAAIGLFYGAGLTWGQHTHLTIVEYGGGGLCTSGWKASSRCSPRL